SRVLEYDKNQVNLYIHKDLPTLDYIDIAIHSISDTLSSPLETLKRRGIPVDRLLKNKQPMKWLLRKQNIIQDSDSHYQQSIEKASDGFLQNIKRNCIDDFGKHQNLSKIDLSQITQTSRSYSQNEFQHSEYSRRENNNLCEYIPSSNMIRYQTLLHNISLYIDENVVVTDPMIEQGKQLAYLLSSIVQEVFHMSQSVVHLFRDINTRIAFNNKGALFFNLRYFEQVFVNDPEFNLENDSIVRTLVNFHFLMFCHELSHNIHLSHDIDFIHCFERVIVKFMNEKELFVSKFSFTSKVN
ncbi:unnamed protein product, partial [Adineta steineri]